MDVVTICQNLWYDNSGFVVSIELVLIATLVVIGLITGMTAVRDAVVSELSDVAGAIQDLNQSYAFTGVSGHSATTAGSDFTDQTDYCDSPEDVSGAADNCIVFDTPPSDEG
ncbi:MAG: Flp family type IVb pilin [Mariniblastus sp.]